MHNGFLNTPIAVFGIEAIFIGLILSDLFSITSLGRFDEVIGFSLLLLVILRLVRPKGRYGKELALSLILFGIALLGFIGNFVYPFQQTPLVVLTGAFLFFKQYIFGLFGLLYFRDYELSSLKSFLTRISKLLLFVLFVCSIASQTFGFGMLGPNGEFSFFASFGGTVACWLMFFLSVCYANTCSLDRLFWFVVAAVTMVLTQSGLGLLGICALPLVYCFYERQRVFHIYYLIPIVLVGIAISWKEISDYLLDPSAPRAELLYFGFVTAFSCFPIGSGFSTYASSMAVSHYSKLYIMYGFSSQWGMSQDNALFLMDSYYPMVIGETGILGLALFIVFVICFMRYFILTISARRIRAAAIYIFCFLLIAGLGFGTGSSWGCAVYLLITLFYATDKKEQLSRG